VCFNHVKSYSLYFVDITHDHPVEVFNASYFIQNSVLHVISWLALPTNYFPAFRAFFKSFCSQAFEMVDQWFGMSDYYHVAISYFV
jgi:hypothetical protein